MVAVVKIGYTMRTAFAGPSSRIKGTDHLFDSEQRIRRCNSLISGKK